MVAGRRPRRCVGVVLGVVPVLPNTDKSHAFERETTIEAKPVTGSDRKIDTITGTQTTSIAGNNVGAYRSRVQRDTG